MTTKAKTVDDTELVVFNGGPWNNWWTTRPRLEDGQRAARALDHPVGAKLPGVSLSYAPTNQWKPNPDGHGDGRIWQWSPTADLYTELELPSGERPDLGHCACGERLLLPGRDQCDRCRLGHELTPRPVHPPRAEQRATCEGCGAFTGVADGFCLSCRMAPAKPEEAVA